jgi:MFS family permease
VLLAVSLGRQIGVGAFLLVLLFVAYPLAFIVARRIGRRKGRRWFWYAFFLHWPGVLLLALLPETVSARSARSGNYHEPPALASQRHRYRNGSLYPRQRGL